MNCKKTYSNNYNSSKTGACFILLAGSVIIFIMTVFIALNTSFMGAAPDELGYLSTSYKLAGWDWEEAFQNYPFYGVGIGVLWTPLFLIFQDFMMIYRGILILNGIFLILSYWISYLCARRLFQETDPKYLAAVCLCISFYPSNIFYMQNALTETLLYLLFWITVFLVLKIIAENKWYWYVILAGVQAYMMIVHMRTVVIVIAVSVFLLIHSIRTKRKSVLLFLGIVFLGFLVMKFIQMQYVENTVSTINTVNTSVGTSGKIKDIITDPLCFVTSVLGEIFGWTVSGNICFFAGAVFCVKKGISSIKTKNVLNECCLFLVIVAGCCLGAFASNRFILNRMDTIVYLRYIENTVGPFLMMGLVGLGLKYQKVNQYFRSAFVIFILVANWLVLYRIPLAENNIFDTSSSVVMGSFFDYYVGAVDNAFTLLKIVSIVLVFAFIIFTILDRLKCRKGYTLAILCVMMFGYWFYMGYGAMEKQIAMKDSCYEQYSEVVKSIHENHSEDIVYWQESLENNDLKKAKYLQTMLGICPVRVMCEQTKDVEKIQQEGVILLTDKDDDSLLDDRKIKRKEFKKILSTELFDGYLYCK